MVPTSLTFDRTKQRALPVWLPILAALLIVARVVSLRYPVTSDVDLIQWTPIGAASRAALRSHKPVLYEFSAEWCGPCHLMEREVFMDKAMAAKINSRYIAVKVVDRQREEGRNLPEVQQLMDRFSVSAFPTIVVTSADGQFRDRALGYRGRDNFAAFIDRVR